MKTVLLAAVAAIATVGSPTVANAAALTGTTVTGTLAVDASFSLTTPFPASAVVGPSTEFTGAFHDNGFNQDFTITANFSDTELLIAFSSPASAANVSASRALASVSFGSAGGFFTPAGALTRVGCTFNCANTRTPLSFSANANTISAGFNSIYAGDVYRLALTPSVPEPATWAMMMLGFGGMGLAMRRKAKVSTRIRFA